MNHPPIKCPQCARTVRFDPKAGTYGYYRCLCGRGVTASAARLLGLLPSHTEGAS